MGNKKAMEWPFQIIIAAVVLLIVGGTMLYAWGQASAPLGKELTQKKLQFGQGQCRAKAELDSSLLKNDMDNDGQPDFCDICPLFDNNADDDHDYMPDGCDKDPTNTNIFECKYGTDERGQCKKEELGKKAKAPSAPDEMIQRIEKQKIRSAEAKEKYDKAVELFNNGDYDASYIGITEIVRDYKDTNSYPLAFNKFGEFDVIFHDRAEKENNIEIIFQHYRNALSIGVDKATYNQKMALATERFFYTYIALNNFTGAEKLLDSLEKSLETPLDSVTFNLVAQMYSAFVYKLKEKSRKQEAEEWSEYVCMRYGTASSVKPLCV